MTFPQISVARNIRLGSQRGLTLLELLVVVTILAILTTVATRSLGTLSEQAQFDSNDQLAKEFKRALVGVPGSIQSDGSPSVTGFIADHGRPPRAELEAMVVGENEGNVAPTGQAYTLKELSTRLTSPPYNLYSPINASTITTDVLKTSGSALTVNILDPTIRTPAGWRGPYIKSGDNFMVRDSWGKPIAAYSVPADRYLVDFWTTSYTENTAEYSILSSGAVTSPAGYHAIGSTLGRGQDDVVGIVFRPGAGSQSGSFVDPSLLAAYSNTISAGIAYTNDFVAQLSCNITFSTNSSLGFSSPWAVPPTNYNICVGVVMYGPNPYMGNTTYFAATPVLTTPPLAASWSANTAIDTLGAGAFTGSVSTFPNVQTVTFGNNPVWYANVGSALAVVNSKLYPLVMGPRVVKPVFVAIRKSSSATPVSITNIVGTVTNIVSYPLTNAVFYGSPRSIVLRPGYNTVQLSIP